MHNIIIGGRIALKQRSWLTYGLWGAAAGLVNGLLGTGGGLLAVAVFQRQGLTANQAHAAAVGLMLPLSAISLTILLFQYEQQLLCYWPLIIPTILGSVTGSWLLKRVKPQRLSLLFIALIIYSAIRILSS